MDSFTSKLSKNHRWELQQMSQFKKGFVKTERQEENPSQAQPLNCSAYGCGLTGTLSAGTNGESKFYCRFHFGLKPSKNDQVTVRIHQNDKLRNIFDMCTNPEKFFRGNNKTTFFALADKKVSELVCEMGLNELHSPKNLLKTRKNIIGELDKRTFVIDDDGIPMPKDMDVGNHYLDKINFKG